VSGVFAEWQPRYAEHGVATFPVKDKRPCVRGWQTVGLNGSSQLAMKFADADAFGFRCGTRNRITLIDIDANDERMVGEAVRLFGESPILWRTGSGNYAMPFRHNGEARRIRPVPGLPIDVLAGGYAVAPPSMGTKQRYEFVQGSLADLDRLPIARGDRLAALRNIGARIPLGTRDKSLFRFALEQAQHVDDIDALIDVVRTRNMDCEPPMLDADVVKAASSAWRYEQEGRNFARRGRAMVTAHSTFDALIAESPDAWLLYSHLRRHHWGRDFALAKAMAKEPALGCAAV
jgi:Bifunctional DNA primase/polymerase, N-terminal